MRPFLFLALLFATINCRSQVANGSFEDFSFGTFAAWNYTCECGLPTTSADTPGTGAVSLDLTAEQQQCFCEVTFDLYQDLPWFTPGVWTLSYWIKGHNGFGLPAGVAVAYRAGFGFPPISNVDPGVTDTNWTYHEDVFAWDGIWPPVDSLLLMVAAGSAPDGERHAYFDDIQLTPLTTGVSGPQSVSRPFCYPVPATDRVSFRLDEVPVQVIAVDNSGRELQALEFTTRGGTIDVGISALPAGCGSLRIRTRTTVHTLRFVKQ